MNIGHTQMDTKPCSKCKEVKSFSDFYRNKSHRDGHSSECKICADIVISARKAANPKETKLGAARRQRTYRKRHPARSRSGVDRWQATNRVQVAEILASWKRDNAGHVNATTARRKVEKLKATPVWADRGLIDATYTMATAMTRLTGVKYHVDHIVPLKSKLVCGLHVGCNLQLLPAKENTSKGNRHWPDMP